MIRAWILEEKVLFTEVHDFTFRQMLPDFIFGTFFWNDTFREIRARRIKRIFHPSGKRNERSSIFFKRGKSFLDQQDYWSELKCAYLTPLFLERSSSSKHFISLLIFFFALFPLFPYQYLNEVKLMHAGAGSPPRRVCVRKDAESYDFKGNFFPFQSQRTRNPWYRNGTFKYRNRLVFLFVWFCTLFEPSITFLERYFFFAVTFSV